MIAFRPFFPIGGVLRGTFADDDTTIFVSDALRLADRIAFAPDGARLSAILLDQSDEQPYTSVADLPPKIDPDALSPSAASIALVYAFEREVKLRVFLVENLPVDAETTSEYPNEMALNYEVSDCMYRP